MAERLGEVAGAVFVIPSFLLVEIDGHPLWGNLRAHYWDASMLLVTGGMLGVLFTVLIRRALFSDKSLPWPESVASVEITRAGAVIAEVAQDGEPAERLGEHRPLTGPFRCGNRRFVLLNCFRHARAPLQAASLMEQI